jgi:glycosyltransferase involved in cell wall biosynthesis
LKVAVFFTWDYSLTTWSESGTLIRELKFFQKIENDNDVSFSFFTYGTTQDSKLAFEYKLEEINPIYSSVRQYKSRLLRIVSSIYLPFKFKEKIESVDLLFQNQLLGCWVPILIKKIYKKPLIIRTGYDMLDFAKHDKKSNLIIFLYKILTNFAVKNCDYFTVTSKNDLNRFLSKYPKYKHKFLLRPNWVEVNELKEFSERHSNRVLAVGRLVSQKNFSYLISEFENFKKDLVIDIVGTGPDIDKLTNQAKKQNVNINLIGSLNNEELLKLYQEYKYYISTSLFEGNPKSLLEAMGSGCIVLGSNISNHSEIISDNKNGYLFEIKNSCLKRKFKAVLQDRANLPFISTDAYIFVRDEYSLNNSAESFYLDFEKTLSR